MDQDNAAALALKDPLYFIESCLTIVDKNSERVPFIPNSVQRVYFQRRTQKDIIVKARKMGFSAFISALWLHACVTRQHTRAIMVSDEQGATNRLFRRVKDYIKHSVIPINCVITENEVMFPDTESSFWIGTAGAKSFGRGDDVTHAHLCLDASTLVLLADGTVKAILDVKNGDIVRTHTGKLATVKSISRTPAAELKHGGKMVEIKAWGNSAFPLRCTPDHLVYACRLGFQQSRKRGKWMAAKDLVPGVHYLGIPRRDYKSKKHVLKMSHLGTEHGRRARIEDLEMDYGLGYFFGVYLAEGTVLFNGKHPTAITFTLDRDEVDIAESVRRRVEHIANGRMARRKDSRTMTMTVYNAALARLVAETAGHGPAKRIPDVFFRAPRAFLDGLVRGYLDGDGHYSPRTNDIYVTSVRPQLLTQLRDLLVALYFGYSSLHRRDAGFWYGRNCQESFTLCISGKTASRLRRHFGIPIIKDFPAGRRSHWKRDRKYIWTPVASVAEISTVAEAYDIVLDHPDHSFRTISATVHNSEVAHYENPAVLTGITEALVNDSWLVMETTANGAGTVFHKDLWLPAWRKESGFQAYFVPWFDDPEYFTESKAFELDEAEQKLRRVFGLNYGQLAWRRWKLGTMADKKLFPQEYPATSQEAFLASGNMVFDWEAIETLEREAAPVKWRGDLRDTGLEVKIEPNKDGPLLIFKSPDEKRKYVLVGDASQGIRGKDYSVADVYDTQSWEQVAQWRGYTEPDRFAKVEQMLGATYNWALVAQENNYPGNAVVQELVRLEYPNVYYDIEGRGEAGFKTTQKTKDLYVTAGRAAVRDYDVKINSPWTIEELRTFVSLDGGKMEAQSGCHDDTVTTLCAACYILGRMSSLPEEVRPKLRDKLRARKQADFHRGRSPTGRPQIV